MLRKTCGCTLEHCGCCEGTEPLTPMPKANRAGLSALQYRVGTHGSFLETMKARLPLIRVDAPGADGQTIEHFQPLAGLSTRESADPTIALLDGWATAADVLTFYQERIANEGYLATATERRSVLELARLVGYELRPGVASTVFLAYTLEDGQNDPVEIPEGARAQSIPGPEELPQAFETSEKLLARRAWNNLQVRRSRPQDIRLDNALALEALFVGGTDTALETGDKLLLVYDESGDPSVLRTVAATESDFDADHTKILLQPTPLALVACVPLLDAFIESASPHVPPGNSGAAFRMVREAREILTAAYLGLHSDPATWGSRMLGATDGDPGAEINALFAALVTAVNDVLQQLADQPDVVPVTDPSIFVDALLKPPVPQAPSSARLSRSLTASAARGSDLHPQLLVNFAPRLKTSYYQAWANAVVNDSVPTLQGVFALRLTAPLFGASVPKQPTYNDENQLNPQSQWLEWDLDADEAGDTLFLDQGHKDVLPGGFLMIHTRIFGDTTRLVRPVREVEVAPRTAYGISGESTRVAFDENWWSPGEFETIGSTLRRTLVYAQSEKLTLVEEPITSDVSGQEIELGVLYDELTSGRWIILSGERADIEAVDGVRVAELLMISGLKHGYDPDLPGDHTLTTLQFATETAYVYKRETLSIYANVVKATHGETREEILGSGDAAQALQSFELKQPPLTFVSAPNPQGVESTLKVYVNGVRWHEADTFAGLGPDARAFITETDDAGKTRVIFGNGDKGARLPTGVENVDTQYRSGIGQPGNVRAEQISLLQSRPLGVKEVINPLRASGGADAEDRDQARESTPLAVMALDRLVSLRDYADFTRTFAGIAKADALRLSDGARQLVHLTIAGLDDVEIDPDSDSYRNLLLALRRLGDPNLPIQVDQRELLVLVMSAGIRLDPDYRWDDVAAEVRERLLDTFSFRKRSLGQPALLSELVGLIQNVPGVLYLDVDAFGAIPEKRAEADGTRRLLTLDELAAAAQSIVKPPTFERSSFAKRPALLPPEAVIAKRAGIEQGGIRPAQLAVFSPAVPDLLILNQIT